MRSSSLFNFFSLLFAIFCLISTGCGGSDPEVAENSTPCDTSTCGTADLADELVTMAAYLDPVEKTLFVLEEYADTMPQVIGATPLKDGWFTVTQDFGDTSLTLNFQVEPMKTRKEIWTMRLTDPAEESTDANPIRILARIGSIVEFEIEFVVHDSAECCVVRSVRHEECIRLPVLNHSIRISEGPYSKCKKVNYRKFCVEADFVVRIYNKCNTIDCTPICEYKSRKEFICGRP